MTFFNKSGLLLAVAAITMQATISSAFSTPRPVISGPVVSDMKKLSNGCCKPLFMAEAEGENQVVELADDETEEQAETNPGEAAQG